ncbi:MAG: hypothetical protein MMC33_008476 [Icmadophila ericetorum]|nr:hypothetical protein [Icmadophila ericetorum]
MGGDGGKDKKEVTSYLPRVQSFLTSDGTYDFSRDAAGVSFLKVAAYNYSVPYITFFINAAPSYIADNDQACGWSMTSAKIPAFAEYINTVVSFWIEANINITYISPMNEPDNSRADCGQEGMAVAPPLRSSVFQTIRGQLNEGNASHVQITGDETSQPINQGILENPLWLPSAAQYLSNVAVHNYDYPYDSAVATYYTQVKILTGKNIVPIKLTETCCSTNNGSGPGVFGSQNDPTMVNALIVARYVWQFLTIANAESFDWWTAVADLPCSPTIDGAQCATALNATSGYNSGLIYIDPNYNQTQDYTLYLTKRAFAVKHFSYFIRPAAVRYDIEASSLPSGVVALATQGPATVSGSPLWNTLFINSNTSPQTIEIQLPGNGEIQGITQTTEDVDFGSVTPLPAVNNRTVLLELPAQSMWSMQFI